MSEAYYCDQCFREVSDTEDDGACECGANLYAMGALLDRSEMLMAKQETERQMREWTELLTTATQHGQGGA